MKKIIIALAAFALLVTPAIAADRGDKKDNGHGKKHWSYEGDTGPANWGDFSKTCATGKAQSPINIVRSDVITGHLAPIDFHYSDHAKNVVNNGHGIQLNLKKGSYIVVDGERFDLLQFHFHSPSEEQLNGKNQDMVAHLVHKSAKGQLAVVAVLFNADDKNDALKSIWEKMPSRAGDKESLGSFDVAAMLPENKAYYHFMGSLTTPPCSENVKWYVLQKTVSVGSKQLSAFRKLYYHTNRPVQALNGRVIVSGN